MTDESYSELQDRVGFLLNRIENFISGGHRVASDLADRNRMEQIRLAEHGKERQEYLAATRELRQVLGKLGLL